LLSDEYVALQLKMRTVDARIAAAESRINWADSVGAAQRYPREWGTAQTQYQKAMVSRDSEAWDAAIDAANQVLEALALVTAAPPVPAPVPTPVSAPAPEPISPPKPALPAQYTVRPWAIARDCLWNIAGRPWVYGDPTKWSLLYEANRSNMSEPNNPDLIHPGMVLIIPSIQGEVRNGMWDTDTVYPVFGDNQ
jgi:nucleoid-associated protein YgaU